MYKESKAVKQRQARAHRDHESKSVLARAMVSVMPSAILARCATGTFDFVKGEVF